MPSVLVVRRFFFWVLIIVGIAGGAAVISVLVAWSQAPAPVINWSLGPTRTTTSPDAVAYGTVSNAELKPIPGSVVHLVIVNADGKEISRHQIPVDDAGTFSIPSSAIPMVSNVAAGMVVAEADSYLASKANVILTATQGGATSISPSRIQLFLKPYNSALVFILLLPAVFGLVMALVHLTGYSRSLRVSQTYAIGTACLWGFIVLWLLWLYASQRGRSALIPLFWDDLFISSGVVVFAFVGTMVYVAYSMHEKDAGFFEMPRRDQRRILLTLGGRVLVGPYVAVAAYGILASTFPVLNTGSAAAFFGFFTGLWIKPVLEALNDIGLRLLSVESRQKVADRLLNQQFDFTPPTSSAERVRVETAFLERVAEARAELLKREGVIGVGAGEKVTDGLPTGRKAIVVYVYGKRELAPGDPAAIPASIDGFPTDVQVVPPPPANDGCHSVMLDISPEKIYGDQQASGIASSVTVVTDTPVPYLVDGAKSLYFGPPDIDNKKFVILSGYNAVRSTLGDLFDFVAFVLEEDIAEGYYYRPIFNDVKGIDFYWEQQQPSPYDVRAVWGVNKLRGVLVFSPSLNLKTCLHEVGHAWSSYTRFRSARTQQRLLDGNRQHWSFDVDYAGSCMADTDKTWSRRTDGSYVEATMADFVYSPLDLYLMGLLPIDAVPRIHFLKRVPLSQPSAATVSDFADASEIGKLFKRQPEVAAKPPHFRMAFVAVATTDNRGRALAQQIETFRTGFEAAFAHACTYPRDPASGGRELATLSTSRT